MPLISVYNRWLPDALAKDVERDEPGRYAALVDALEREWRTLLSTGDVGAATDATLKYLAPLKGFFSVKVWLPRERLVRLVDLIVEIVLRSARNLAAQSRWARFAAHALRQLPPRRLRGWTTAWRPLRDAFVTQSIEARTAYEGGAVAEQRREHLARLVAQLRRHFPRGAAGEIWAELAPEVCDTRRPETYDALGLLVLLMPTTGARRRDGDWGTWAREWAKLWASAGHCTFVDGAWAALFARLARDDRHGLVPWGELTPLLYARGAWAFELPVGGALAAPPCQTSAPKPAEARFSGCFPRRAASLARIAMGTIGHMPLPGGAAEDDLPLAQLEALAALLDQYYHPSNGGRWAGALASFLRELVSQFTKRLVSEAPTPGRTANGAGGEGPGDESDQEDSDSDLEDEDGDEYGDEGETQAAGSTGGPLSAGRSNEGDVSSEPAASEPPSDEEASVRHGSHESSGAPSRRAPLDAAQQRRLARVVLRLASQAQFSKDRDLSRAASGALAAMAELDPYLTLPLVHGRLAGTLDDQAASGQLSTALGTLGLCVRPLLTHGFDPAAPAEAAPPGEPPAAGEPPRPGEVKELQAETFRAAGVASVIGAMQAMLPGVDANDPPKSLAAFRFFAAALSSLRALPPTPTEAFPLDAEVWTEMFLDQVFAILANLDLPDAGGEPSTTSPADASQGSSFLLDGSSMFRPVLELLFARLPAAVRTRAASRTARFLLGTTMPSVAAEASVLGSALALTEPELAARLLLAPLLETLAAEAAALEARGGGMAGASGHAAVTLPEVGKSREAAAAWRLQLLAGLAGAAGAACEADPGLAARLVATLRSLARSGSVALAEAVSHALSSLLSALLTAGPADQHAPSGWALVTPGSELELDAYLDRTGWPHEAPAWRLPGDAELSLADALVAEFLGSSSHELLRLAADGTLSAGLAPQAGGGSAAESVVGGTRGREAASPGERVTKGGGAGTARLRDRRVTANGSQLRAHVRGLLLGMSGVLCGAGTALPDLEGCAPRADYAGLVGSLAPEGLRSEAALLSRNVAAQALLAFLRAAPDADSDTLSLGWSVAEALLAAGWMEHQDASSASSTWSSDERWVSTRQLADIALARSSAQLVRRENGEGTPTTVGPARTGRPQERPRRRRPRWLVVEKASINLRWRASSTAYRWWVTPEQPVARASDVPAVYVELLALAAEHAMHLYRDVRAAAGAALERSLMRYPALAGPPSSALLCALAPEEGDGGGTAEGDLLSVLEAATRKAPARAAAVARDGSEAKEVVARAAGAAAQIRTGRSLWRHSAGSWRATAELMAGLLASSGFAAPEVAQEVSLTAFVYSLRFYAPQGQPGDLVDRVVGLAANVAMDRDWHWRHRVLAAVLMLCVLPSARAGPAAAAVAAATGILATEQAPLLRNLAASVLLSATLPSWAPRGLLPGALRAEAGATLGPGGGVRADGEARPATVGMPASGANGTGPSGDGTPPRDLSPEARTAAYDAVLASTRTDGFWPDLFTQLANGHVSLARGGEAGARRAAGVEETMAKLVGSTVTWGAVWPGGRETVAAISEGWFLPTHASVFQALAGLAPAEAAAGLRASVEAALAAPRDREAPLTAAAGEAIAGLVAAGVLGEGRWVAAALREQLATAPVDALHVSGGAVLRYCVYHGVQPLARASAREAWASVADLLVGLLRAAIPSPGGGGAGSASPGTGAATPPPVNVLGVADPTAALRALGYTTGAITEAVASRGAATEDPHVLALLEALADVLPGLAAGAGGHLVRPMAAYAVATLASICPRGSDGGTGSLRRAALATRVSAFLGSLQATFTRDVEELARQRGTEGDSDGCPSSDPGTTPNADRDVRMTPADDLDDPADSAPAELAAPGALYSRVAFFVEVVRQALDDGENGTMPQWLIGSLAPLLRVQELVPSELASIRATARQALALLKYLPLSDTTQVSAARAVLAHAARSALWTERASALSYLQYFWFRSFHIPGEQRGLTDAVVGCLADPRAEVRELASNTLSGLIKGLPAKESARLRARLLAGAKRLVPARRRMGVAPGEERTASLPGRHAAVLGLRAFVLSTPYDAPGWLPDVLMALVRLAGEPPPISTTVTKTLAEFRRTHEEAGLTRLREQLTLDQWEAIRDVAHPATYFV